MTISVTHLLEDETKLCIQFSSTHATWLAHSKADAIIGAAKLIGQGMSSVHFFEPHSNAWQIQTFF